MKKSLLILASLLIAFSSYSQDSTNTQKQKEVAIGFSSLNSFGLSYKFGKPNSLWRINTIIATGSNIDETSDSVGQTYSNFNIKFRFGKEFRKSLTEKLEFRYGADLSFGYTNRKSERDDKTISNNDILNERITYSPGLNLVLGFNYLISDNILIGAEILPSFEYVTGTSEQLSNGTEIKSDISGFNYGFTNSSALLTFAYRF